MNNIIYKILIITILLTCVVGTTFCAFTISVEKTGSIQTTELSTKLLSDSDFLSKIQSIDPTITSIDKENDLTRASSISNEYLINDNIFSTNDANVPTYLWIDSGTIYYYTIAPDTAIDYNIQ